VPTSPVTITACGQLQPDDHSLTVPISSADDPYEDYPEDNDNPSLDIQQPATCLKIVRELRALGNARWRESAAVSAMDKWRKALRYLDVHPVLPDDEEQQYGTEFRALRIPILLNLALAAVKVASRDAAEEALDVTERVLGMELVDADRGACSSVLSPCASYLIGCGHL